MLHLDRKVKPSSRDGVHTVQHDEELNLSICGYMKGIFAHFPNKGAGEMLRIRTAVCVSAGEVFIH